MEEGAVVLISIGMIKNLALTQESYARLLCYKIFLGQEDIYYTPS